MPTLAVGSIASTTRWVKGVLVNLECEKVILVDTPGYGEIMTANDYASSLIRWVRHRKSEICTVLLVIQADSKAHAEDKQILEQILHAKPGVSVFVVLSQVDKVLPIRQPLDGNDWPLMMQSETLKSKHIAEKIQEVCEQFGIEARSIVPAAAGVKVFNRKQLLNLIEESLG